MRAFICSTLIAGTTCRRTQFIRGKRAVLRIGFAWPPSSPCKKKKKKNRATSLCWDRWGRTDRGAAGKRWKGSHQLEDSSPTSQTSCNGEHKRLPWPPKREAESPPYRPPLSAKAAPSSAESVLYPRFPLRFAHGSEILPRCSPQPRAHSPSDSQGYVIVMEGGDTETSISPPPCFSMIGPPAPRLLPSGIPPGYWLNGP